MSDFFTLTPGKPPVAAAQSADEIARGDDWSIKRRGEAYVLEYWSGQLADHLESVEITGSEAEALRAGKTSVDKLLLAKGLL